MLVKSLALGLSLVAGLVTSAGGAPARGEPARAEAGCHETSRGYTCFYGPYDVDEDGLAVPPSLVPAPNEEGYITDARAAVVDARSDRISRHVIHLHHAVWVNPVEDDVTCAALPGDRFFASGKERTPMHLPDGIGYHWANEASPDWPYNGNKGWGMVAHLDSMHQLSHDNVYIRLRMGFTPSSEETLDEMRPVWIDVNGSCTANPTFDVPKGGSDDRFRLSDRLDMPLSGRFVGMAGHLHDGGLRLRLRNDTTGQRIYTSRARYEDDSYRWFLTTMTSFYDDPGIAVSEGDELELTAVYDSSRRRRDAMGIMLGALVEDE